MNGELLQLFPTPVGRFNFRSLTPVEEKVLEHYCLDLDRNASNSITRNKSVLNDPELFQLKTDITGHVNEYYNMIYRPINEIRLYITSSWCNVSTKEEYHHRHLHLNSLISGTYYIQADSTDTITFIKDVSNRPSIVTYPEEQNIFNQVEYDCNVDKNMLVLFSSLLEHYVKPLNREGRRISLSFNTFCTGMVGDIRHLTHLQL